MPSIMPEMCRIVRQVPAKRGRCPRGGTTELGGDVRSVRAGDGAETSTAWGEVVVRHAA
jgi:hypothetical protein